MSCALPLLDNLPQRGLLAPVEHELVTNPSLSAPGYPPEGSCGGPPVDAKPSS